MLNVFKMITLGYLKLTDHIEGIRPIRYQKVFCRVKPLEKVYCKNAESDRKILLMRRTFSLIDIPNGNAVRSKKEKLALDVPNRRRISRKKT